MSTTNRLPGKLSDLLYVALEDLEKVERDPLSRRSRKTTQIGDVK